MEIKKVIDRLNYLYRKRVDKGLTEEELVEQSRLRRRYLDAIKGNLRNQLENIRIVDVDESTTSADGTQAQDNGDDPDGV